MRALSETEVNDVAGGTFGLFASLCIGFGFGGGSRSRGCDPKPAPKCDPKPRHC